MSTPSTTATLSLPKGGGAIRGIGETFQANLFSGTANHKIPIALSSGRSGFGPELSLEYSSGNGNGLFGLGWQLSLPRITRKTEKGLPRYDDDDVFVMSGAEDLVPILKKVVDPASGQVTWAPEPAVAHGDFSVFRYRPRTEGLFARIERWVHAATGETHWRTLTQDNLTMIFGATASSRVADPKNEQRVYEWLPQETFDAFGNRCVYEYAADDPALYTASNPNLHLPEAFEQRRLATQRYIRRIYYGNIPEPLVDTQQRPITYPDGTSVGHLRGGRHYAFEVVFDYGDWQSPTVLPHPNPPADDRHELFGTSATRTDRFSHFRAGFDIRTLRLCRRVLMFHHFAELGAPTLVRSTDFTYRTDPDTQVSLLNSVTATGYDKDGDGQYRSASMPPVDYSYTGFKPREQRYQSLRAIGGEMPPLALSDPNFALVDLFGDGLPDILHTGPAGFRYWRNLGEGKFDRPRTLAQMPADISLDQPGVGFGDMEGKGIADLLLNAGPMPGFFETTFDGAWQRFTPYETSPTFDPQDPNVRMLDLTGDGRADALLTDDRQFLWFQCLGAKGFAPPQAVERSHDLNLFPDVFFDDSSGRVRLADMTGDGLNDIVLVHDGGIDYWPNLGYGRFGPRVAMANSPRLEFDFDPKRLFLADLNGTGSADLVYVDTQRVYFWFNRSGNSWSERQTILGTPRTTDASALQFADIFGTGTTALLWSRDFVDASDGNYKALDFCGGIKPYILTQVDNNLGATTRVSYAPSTRFFLEDRAKGSPWIAPLPFPVQVVDRVEVIDHVSQTKQVSTYQYHHGHYDGREREFCGFGRIDAFDAETLPGFSHVPPVETRTWFHTGIYFDDGSSRRIDYRDLTERFRQEYYSQDSEAPPLREHEVETGEMPSEAYRVLRGAQLRKEVYARDGSGKAQNPYVVNESRYHVAQLQPQGGNRHAVYFRHQLEDLSYHYERDPTDPRISHALTLEVDAFGHALRTLSIAYGRRLPALELPTQADRDRQTRTLISYTESRYTNPIDDPQTHFDAHHVPASSETLTFELTGFAPLASTAPRFDFDEWLENDFARIENASNIDYEAQADSTTPQKRLIERIRTSYRKDDLSDLLPLGVLEPLALPGETHRLAFTKGLVSGVYGDRVNEAVLSECRYIRGEDAATWWISSGREFYSPTDGDTPSAELAYAQQHFFVPFRARDPFGFTTFAARDPYVLLVNETRDAIGNRTLAEQDYRLLQPVRLTDLNGNRSAVAYDTLGLVAGTAVMGKVGTAEGDSLDGFEANLTAQQREAFMGNPLANPGALLGSASTRIVYDFERFRREGKPIFAAVLARETHAGDPLPADGLKAQLRLTYSDGLGREVQKKAPAEPGPLIPDGPSVPARWVGSGWIIYNNKGKAIKQFEPFFDDTHEFRFDRQAGVSSTLFYDPLERVVGKLHPNHTWEKVVFDPWREITWDVNDTALIADPKTDPDVGRYFQLLAESDYLPTWHAERVSGRLGDAEHAAATKTAQHADTPSVSHTDALGRTFLSIAHNRLKVDRLTQEELQISRVILDIEGNQRESVDANGRIAMRCDFDMLGNRIHQISMEAGERWTLQDIGGQTAFAWDSRGHRFRNTYDALRRPVDAYLRDAGDVERLISHTVFGESAPNAEALNLRGKIYQRFDQAGVVTTDACDFKGNPLSGRRQLAKEYKTTVDWSSKPALETEIFVSRTTYDALNRPVALTSPDGSVTRPKFNRVGLLEKIDVQLQGLTAATPFVTQIEHDAKGQRTNIVYGSGVRTRYGYDPLTFRLQRCQTLRGTEILQDLSYVYDPVGHITTIADSAQQTLFFNNQVVAPSNDYTYDAVYRLLTAEGREHIGQQSQPQTTWNDEPRIHQPHPNDGKAMRRYVERYSYDASGNLLELAHQADNANWSRVSNYEEVSLIEPDKTSNRLRSAAVGSSRETFAYDSHGNLISMPHLPSIGWDFRDQLQRADLGGGGTAFYVYDSGGKRIRKVVEKNGGALIEERITMNGFEVFRRRNAAGTVSLERQSLHVMDDRQRIALVETRTRGDEPKVAAQAIRYQLGNHLNSAALELDEKGQIISYEEYYPFGSTSYQAGRSVAEASLKRYRYSGMERDEETGFGYHGARYYLPWLCRWASCDPAGAIDRQNLYVFCRNNPPNSVDTNGCESKKQGAAGDVNRHGDQGLRGKGTAGALESEHVEPIAVQRENMRNPRTGQSPIPAGRGSAIDRAQPTVMLQKATADAKTGADRPLINRLKAESRAGNVSPATIRELGPEAGLARTQAAARATGTTVPAGARAAAIGQTDAKHADPHVRSFSRNPVNNPLVGASDADISAAVDAPISSNKQSAGELTSLAATKNPRAKTVFQGSYSEVHPPAPPKTAAPARAVAPVVTEVAAAESSLLARGAGKMFVGLSVYFALKSAKSAYDKGDNVGTVLNLSTIGPQAIVTAPLAGFHEGMMAGGELMKSAADCAVIGYGYQMGMISVDDERLPGCAPFFDKKLQQEYNREWFYGE